MTNIKIKYIKDNGGTFSSGTTNIEINIEGYNGTDKELRDLLYNIKSYWLRL